MIVSYLKYRRKAQGKYHLHSPLLFDLYEKILEKTDDCDEIEEKLKAYMSENRLIFKDDDKVMLVRGIHRNKRSEQEWERLKEDEEVRLSVDCWRYGLLFKMERIEKEHYILKV